MMSADSIFKVFEDTLSNIRRISVPRIIRSIRFLGQRLIRGWDDSETWSLDYSLAKLILPRLRRFKTITNSTPYDMTQEEWYAALDKMIAFFEFASSEERWSATRDEYEKHTEGLELFCKHYYSLWW